MGGVMKKVAVSCNRSYVSGKAKLQLGNFLRRNVFGAVLLSFGFLLISSNIAMAQAGKLDRTFGNGGLFTTSLTQVSVTLDNKITVQSDGKVIVAGQIQNH